MLRIAVVAMLQLALVCSCAVRPAMAQGAPAAASRLHGSFLQLLAVHYEWRDEDWKRLFGYFTALGLTDLVVQWSVLDDLAFHPNPSEAGRTGSPLESILAAADEARMRVLVGLAHDSRYWDEIRAESAPLGDYLRRLESRSLAAAQRMTSLLAAHRSFEGWYLPLEVDDVNWVDPVRRGLLFEHLRGLSEQLRRIEPAARIALSGFSNARIDPRGFESFWHGLLASAPAIDVVLLQDGVGAHKLDIAEVPLYMAAAGKAASRNGRELRAVVETFRQTAGPPIDDKPFSAAPAAMDRLQRQLRAAAPFASRIIAFSVPEYLSPAGGPAARRLYEDYLTEAGKQR